MTSPADGLTAEYKFRKVAHRVGSWRRRLLPWGEDEAPVMNPAPQVFYGKIDRRHYHWGTNIGIIENEYRRVGISGSVWRHESRV